jgi:hypothetical protein
VTLPGGPTSPKHGIDPLELVADAMVEAHRLFRAGAPEVARTTFRRRLQEALAVMCPVCGRTDDHEDAEHRWIAPKQRTLGDVRHRVGTFDLSG